VGAMFKSHCKDTYQSPSQSSQKTAVDDLLLQVPPASRGNRTRARFPSRSGGNLKEGGNCKLRPRGRYYIYDPDTGRWEGYLTEGNRFVGYVELRQALEAAIERERQRREEAQRRAEQERRRREEEQRRAEQERLRAEQERLLREQAERRLAELEAELRRLRGE
jgi:hypothetical protein